jgi:hypothetical protein
MALLNELLEEAAARTATLTAEAQTAIEVVDGLVLRVESLAELIGEEGGEAHGRFQALQARLPAAGGELDESGERAHGALQAMAAAAVGAQGRVAELTAAVGAALAEAQARRDELAAAFDQHVEAAGSDCEQLAQRASSLDESGEQRLQEAAQALDARRSAVGAARDGLAAGQAELLATVDALGATAREAAQLFVAGMGEAFTAQTIALFELERGIKEAHNDTVVPLRQTFAEESIKSLAASVAPLREALESAGGACGEHEQALLEAVAGVLERCENAAGSLARSQELLRAADRLA